MYIVIDKKSKEILHINPMSTSVKLPDKEVYQGFSSQKMKIIKTDKVLPAHFKINNKDKVVPLTEKEQLDSGAMSVENYLQSYVSTGDSKGLQKAITGLLKSNLVKNRSQCENVIELINRGITDSIALQYEISYEIKITKDYMGWMQAGNPANDPRAKAYDDMQTFIQEVKTPLNKLKTKLKKLQETLPELKPEKGILIKT